MTTAVVSEFGEDPVFAVRSGGSALSKRSDEDRSEGLHTMFSDDDREIAPREKQEGAIGTTSRNQSLNDRSDGEEERRGYPIEPDAQRESPV